MAKVECEHGSFETFVAGHGRFRSGSLAGRHEEKRYFWIAPTMYMKTKVKFRRKTIAPTILMKVNGLIENDLQPHDIIENKRSYSII